MKLLQKDETLCIQCNACESACSKAYFKEDDREKSRIKINDEREDARDWTINVCNQCGECIPVCSEEAITRNKQGVVMIDSKKCVGCYMCVGFCPSLSMRTHDDGLVPFKCVACGICAKECPTDAIFVETR
jgi:anaerobic carbon-monoxide dehydrogenase iron sulfur subunit